MVLVDLISKNKKLKIFPDKPIFTLVNLIFYEGVCNGRS